MMRMRLSRRGTQRRCRGAILGLLHGLGFGLLQAGQRPAGQALRWIGAFLLLALLPLGWWGASWVLGLLGVPAPTGG